MFQEIDDRSKLKLSLKAAQLYYLQDLTMEYIGKELNVSRSSVSRLLQMARDRGIVEIKVNTPDDAPRRIASQLKDKYGVSAHLVPVAETTSHVERLDRVALSAARMLPGFFSTRMTMGIAWGSTITAVSRNLTRRHVGESRIVQLNGAGNDHTTGVIYSGEILRRFGEAFGSVVEQFPVPAFFDDPAAKKILWKEMSIKRILDIQGSLDVALFGLGALHAEVPSHVYAAGYLNQDDLDGLNKDRVVGDVATVFFREDGSWEDVALNQRSSGLDLDILKRAPRRICVVAGTARLQSLHGALAGNLITDLIIDDETAKALLSEASEN
ncbi:MAG: sugar-binding transcriptional regulator [Aquiluna sp.]|nr:sugar-binding transcriptional regulator [Aquiluna sp.]MCF8545470.1 sugar-binding transcriptional regulator [Aquiluna sp.]